MAASLHGSCLQRTCSEHVLPSKLSLVSESLPVGLKLCTTPVAPCTSKQTLQPWICRSGVVSRNRNLCRQSRYKPVDSSRHRFLKVNNTGAALKVHHRSPRVDGWGGRPSPVPPGQGLTPASTTQPLLLIILTGELQSSHRLLPVLSPGQLLLAAGGGHVPADPAASDLHLRQEVHLVVHPHRLG